MKHAQRLCLFIVVASSAGCQTAKPPVTTTFYFCGCQQCAKFAKSSGSDMIGRSTIVFAGGPGDAEKFRSEFGPNAALTDDPDGGITRKAGINECPSAIVARGDKRVVLGNGAALTKESIERTRDSMEATQ